MDYVSTYLYKIVRKSQRKEGRKEMKEIKYQKRMCVHVDRTKHTCKVVPHFKSQATTLNFLFCLFVWIVPDSSHQPHVL